MEAGFQDSKRPLILLLHGFPELAYSWRKILTPLAEQGFHVVAPDLRGYGRTGTLIHKYEINPTDFFILNFVEDVSQLTFALGHNTVKTVVGHDFGSPVAGWCALTRPDVFSSVVLMSAPFTGAPKIDRSKNQIHKDLLALSPPRKHYQWYYTERRANNDMLKSKHGLKAFLRAYYHMKSGDWKGNEPFQLSDWNASQLSQLPFYYVMEASKTMAETVASEMPSEKEIQECEWLTDIELDFYVKEYSRSSFQGGLNCYWNTTQSNFIERLLEYKDHQINVPSAFIAGKMDWGVFQVPGALKKMEEEICSSFLGTTLIPGAGHWVQQENPKEVIRLLGEFIKNH